MDILVVIPCLNEERTIAAVLDQLLKDEAVERMLICVSDGGSTDMTRSIVRHYVDRLPGRVTLIDNRKRIQSAAVNLAARTFGEGKHWLVRVDAHAVYPENYVSRLVGAAERQDADSVVVPMYTSGQGAMQSAIAAALNSRFGTGGSAHRHPGRSLWVDHGHHALFRMDRFCEVGGYDETFSHNEDAEFDIRLTRAGGRVWLQGDLPITYFPRRTLGALFRQYYAYGRGRARTVMRHHTPMKARQKAPFLVPFALAIALIAPFEPLLAIPAAIWVAACLGAGLSLAFRQGRPGLALSGAAFMVLHLSWGLGFLAQALGAPRHEALPEPIRLSSAAGLQAARAG